MSMAATTTTLSEAAMLRDLRATFPMLWMRPLRDFSNVYAETAGVWTGQDSAHVMPDGLPIFSDLAGGVDAGDDVVHPAFQAWLQRRGWTADRYDGTTWLLVPERHFDLDSDGGW
jgi:hypothetical protein